MDSKKGVFIPEILIHRAISGIVNFVKKDLRENIPEETYLYKLLRDSKVGDYNFFKQAGEIFSREKDKVNQLTVKLFFDSKRAEIPTIHVLLPSESTGQNGLGLDLGHVDPDFDDIGGTQTPYFTRRFKTNYQIVITSNNSLEVIMLYHILRSAVISSMDALSLAGIQNLSLSGGDLNLHPDIVPATVFVRGFNMSFDYDVSAPALTPQLMITDIFVDGEISASIKGVNDL